MEQFESDWQKRNQTKALEEQAEAMKKQTEIMQKQANEQKWAAKDAKRQQNKQAGKSNFHGLYCLVVGWWLSLILICIIVPLFFSGGRSLIKRAFGFW
jgi:hypothetical protein